MHLVPAPCSIELFPLVAIGALDRRAEMKRTLLAGASDRHAAAA